MTYLPGSTATAPNGNVWVRRKHLWGLSEECLTEEDRSTGIDYLMADQAIEKLGLAVQPPSPKFVPVVFCYRQSTGTATFNDDDDGKFVRGNKYLIVRDTPEARAALEAVQ